MQAASLCWSDEGDAGRQGCCTFVSYALWPVRHVTLLHMNSVVEAALIGVGGSVIAAIVAFVTTWAVTGRTLRADRDRQILDKELATYELALSELMGWQITRLNGQF